MNTRTSLSRLSFLTLAAFGASAPGAFAQWSADPAVNLSVADGSGDQVQAKIAPTADGGCYLSWFDSIGNGFDVRLQRLDANGQELWAHNGVLVADRGFSSTQDYGLDVDASGNALLVFRDDRPGGIQITAAKIDPSGAALWGAGGVTLTSTANFVAAPKIAGTSDGHAVIAWREDVDVRMQRLDATGTSVWASDLVLTPPAGAYTVADLHDAFNHVILSIVHQTGAQIFTAKHLLAQRFDQNGAPFWGASPLPVFDGGSLQIGNFPTFVPDGQGGAVFGWYSVSPLQCWAQHILANGAEAFPHNGTEGSIHPTQIRANPSVDYDANDGSTYLFWQENNSSQSQTGMTGQRFGPNGARLWGDNGVTLDGLSSTFVSMVETVATTGGSFVFWERSPAFGQDVLVGAHLDASGTVDIPIFDVASTPSSKLRLASARTNAGQVLLAWGDDRVDAGDLLMQNVRPDGGLGNAQWTLGCFGTGCPCGNDDASAGCANSTGSGALLDASGSPSVAADDLVLQLSGGPANQPALVFSGTNPLSNVPFGAGFRCVGGTTVRISIQALDGAGAAIWGPGLAASQGWSAGDLVHLQVWYRDPASSCVTTFDLSNRLSVPFQP